MKWSVQHNKLYTMLFNFMMKQDNTVDKNSFIIDNKENYYQLLKIVIALILHKKVYFS